ncbi:TIM barrel protein [Fictibacillus phosphorivorans]|uniref:TIM barrel protein n=1 Tax=Fictibacillus phosphorivorans TaxID=1221500 RepID=UPI00203EE5EC|nr:TIM barrel protein [Fictibacillus phosphorivorans]MCM3719511.1 sugar phosphate isomerase/epimerase [Fictibacillus phosphorivorans]MCM3777202.1 sugar phosphate isomerase/epimerase [Fictibacillus phosphorivorans]
MTHKIAISGSTIMSDTSLLQDLFIDETSHIEIGELENEAAYKQFLSMIRNSNKSFGLHSPLFRNNSKYDLIEYVQFEPKQSWLQFEDEVKRMAEAGAAYILVHFPYFRDEAKQPEQLIEEGLQKLSLLQEKYDLSIVCEPKLGMWKSARGIEYLHKFPVSLWKKYGLELCIDIGDYLLSATKLSMNPLTLIKKWQDHIKVVHLHNIEFIEGKYIWIPIHPSHENDDVHFPLKEILSTIANRNNVYWVLEHTPHSCPKKEFVMEGIQWLKEEILKIE